MRDEATFFYCVIYKMALYSQQIIKECLILILIFLCFWIFFCKHKKKTISWNAAALTVIAYSAYYKLKMLIIQAEHCCWVCYMNKTRYVYIMLMRI